MAVAPPFFKSLSTGMSLYRPPPWPASLSLPDACHALYLWQQQVFLSFLLWKGYSLLVSSGQDISMVVRDNGWYLVTYGETHPEYLHRLLIEYDFLYLFYAWWSFVIYDLLLSSLLNLIMFVTVKPPGGVNCWFKRHHSIADVLSNRL